MNYKGCKRKFDVAAFVKKMSTNKNHINQRNDQKKIHDYFSRQQ